MPQGRLPVSPDGKREKRCNVDMTVPLYEAVDDFLREHKDPALRSRNDLIEIALKFYMDRYDKAGGETDRQGFPVTVEEEDDEPRPARARGTPQEHTKKKTRVS